MRAHTLFFSLCLAASLACGDNAGTGRVTITQIAPGAQCPAGGVSISSGGSVQVVCNGVDGQNGDAGTNGVTTLIKQTPLARGDAHCPKGGARVDSGPDTNANGALDDAEITATAWVCSGLGGPNVRPIDPPAGAPGTGQILARGGDTDGGTGGTGGQISIGFTQYGTYGGHVEVFKTGSADAKFDVPAVPAPNFGTTPATVTGDLLVPDSSFADAGLADGALYLYNGILYISGPAHEANTPSGFSVAAGKTLSFDQSVEISVQGSCVNQGNIVAPLGLSISCGDFYGDTGSSISTAGAAATGGGGLSIDATSVWNRGALDASGGSGPAGANGGAITLSTDSGNGDYISVYNTGAIKSTGGIGATGAGGVGGSVRLFGGNVYNSGPIDASGGSGKAGIPAPSRPEALLGGGAIELRAGNGSFSGGALLNSGALTANGSDVAAGCTANSCTAGTGGGITLSAVTTLASSGALTTHGGSSPDGTGGTGGAITVTLHGGAEPRDAPAPGDMVLSGSLDSSGGAGALGGDGASIQVSYNMDYPGAIAGQELVLYGYASVDASGGSAANAGVESNGGGGGGISMENPRSVLGGSDGSYYAPGGSIVVHADLICRGGSAPGGAGGNGGSVQLETQNEIWEGGDDYENVITAGSVDVGGGNGLEGGGAGTLSLLGNSGVSASGSLSARGGTGSNGSGGNGALSDGPGLRLWSPNGDVTIGGAIDASGGQSSGTGLICEAPINLSCGASGGQGGHVQVSGRHVSDSAAILAHGGAADASGGGGGSVIVSSYGAPTTITAAAPAGISVAGGTGTPAGSSGAIEIDGRIATGSWTH